jgi:hypothetical protein
MRLFFVPVTWSLLLIAAVSTQVAAQTPAPGVRAAGMGGAFTAMADDASGVYWNPAGLASGSFFSLVLDRNSGDDASASLLALSTPPLGFSYYRTAAHPPDASGSSLVAHHAGITLVQSIGGRLAVGGTVKVVHGDVTADTGGAMRETSGTKFDMDLGVMATGALGRLGLTVHNATEPSFEGPAAPVLLERRVRAGVALHTGKTSTVAADFDLTGGARQAAVGVEAHPVRAAWLRGGIHWNTHHPEVPAGAPADTGSAPIGTAGASYVIYGSTVADAQVSFGSDNGDKGWGIGLRFVF